MSDITAIAQSVDQFINVMQHAPDSALERPWVWGPYAGEGVRFAHFRTYEELRELTVKVQAVRLAQGCPLTEAQNILAQYHRAWRELHAALMWLDAADVERAPAQGEWSLRQVLAHVAGAEIGFYIAVRYALERHRSGEKQPEKVSDEAWSAVSGLTRAQVNATMEGSFADLLAFNHTWHARVLQDFTGIRDDELELPSMFWEDRPFSIRFRLHRFESHLCQHSVQVDKTLVGIGCPPSEVQRLHRLIYSALGDVEGALLGAGDTATAMCEAVAQSIRTRAGEIQAAMMDS